MSETIFMQVMHAFSRSLPSALTQERVSAQVARWWVLAAVKRPANILGAGIPCALFLNIFVPEPQQCVSSLMWLDDFVFRKVL